MSHDLEQMRRNPGSVKRRDLLGALRERGWVLVRESKHQIWATGSVEVQVPHSLKSKWTVQGIVKRMIEVEEGED